MEITKKMFKYRPRIADALLKRKLSATGAVLIEGTKWCGKTTTAERVAKSVLYLAKPEEKDNLLRSDFAPSLMLKGASPRLIDEWQMVPKLWDAIRFEVDHREGWGYFILTGSSTPADTSQIFHSGAGRFARLRMRPMSLFESGDSNGTVSLKALFEGQDTLEGINTLSFEDIAFLICRGGWPGALKLSRSLALEPAQNYVDVVIHSDMRHMNNIARDPAKVMRLLYSYARNQGTQAPLSTLKEDLKANDDATLSDKTIASYLRALRQMFVIEDMSAWNPNLRSKTAIRTSDTRYFVDPSIAAVCLKAGPNALGNDLKTMGVLFETLCVRDLRVYADALGGHVFHYRDKSNLECDCVIHLNTGEYGLIEVKLGGDTLIDEGAKTLLQLRQKIDIEAMKPPSFLMVLTAVGKYAYKRKDGVLVVPIGCLKAL